jgi:hypothetical protein
MERFLGKFGGFGPMQKMSKEKADYVKDPKGGP